jgi:hypothetical protein
MVYRLNLPMRVTTSTEDDKCESSETVCRKEGDRNISFNDESNKTFIVDRTPEDMDPEEVWYSRRDIATFKAKYWLPSADELMMKKKETKNKSSKTKLASPVELQTFGPGTEAGSCNHVYRLLLHQATCRLRGYSDPEGIQSISEQMSKRDKKRATLSGHYNAREVSWYLKESSGFQKAEYDPPTLASSALDYYIECIHPYINNPLMLIGQVLSCETDD